MRLGPVGTVGYNVGMLPIQQTKKCGQCGVVKGVGEFHKRLDGLAAACKPCTVAYCREYRAKHLERLRAFDRARQDRAKTPEARAKNNERQRLRREHDPSINERRKSSPTYAKKYSKPHPHVAAAYMRVQRAIKSGLLIRPDACSLCGRACKPEAAHTDYSRPLDVRWLCRQCHRREDAVNPKGGVRKL